MTYGTHLRRSRHGTLYFRYVIPADVRSDLQRSELSVSLGTGSKCGAELAALEPRLVAKRFIDAARETKRMSEPGDAKRLALRALIHERKFKAQLGEPNEADESKASMAAHVETLTAKLVSMVGTASVSSVGPTLSAAVAAYKTEGRSTEKWTPKTAAAIDGRF